MLTENPTTILFITGAFVSHKCWDEWKVFFENKGFKTLAPAWPYKDAPASVLRDRHPDPQIASIRLTQLIEYFEEIAKSLPQKPIVIGHSIGGLTAQILLQRNLAALNCYTFGSSSRNYDLQIFLFKSRLGSAWFFYFCKKNFFNEFPSVAICIYKRNARGMAG